MNKEEQKFYDEAFSRNIGIFTKDQQRKLKNSTVALAGLGGGGGIYAYTFARLGVGKFHLTDMDVFEVVNINRQAGATMDNMGKKKTDSIKQLVLSINPYAAVKIFDKGIDEKNIDNFLDGVNVVLDGIDFFNIDTRRLLFRAAKEKGIYVICAGPVGFGSAMLVFDPKGISFDEYMDMHDGQSKSEQLVRFGLGLTPSLIQRSYFQPEAVDWKHERAPSLVTGTLMAANLASTAAVKILTGQFNKLRVVPSSTHFDPYLGKLKKVWMPFGNKNPIQRLKRIIISAILKSKGRL